MDAAGRAPPSGGWKRPESVLVLVHAIGGEVLLLRRREPSDFWQSVTGSLEPGETPLEAARRELAEETGLTAEPADLAHAVEFPIRPPWQLRYAPGVTVNREHHFALLLPAPVPVRLAPDEHLEQRWLPWPEALALASSSTNRDAIRRHVGGMKSAP